MCGRFLAHGYHTPLRVAVLPADIVTWFVRDVAVLVFDMLSPLREVRTEESADAVTVLSAYP